MVVVSASWMKNLPPFPTPAGETEIVTNDKEIMAAKAVLICRPNSHHFQDRTVILDQPIKVGRSVARSKPTAYNAIFDCKVLSRHHALLWYENGNFFLQDTKSSNGTFINNNRLTTDSHEVCSGDIVQFGVDVVENNKRVTHGCIIATLKLYLPDGKEAKASPSILEGDKHGVVPFEDLYALNQILQEANQREQCLESKLSALQHVVDETRKSAEESWQAYIGEERLLSRLSDLETQLQQASKNWSEDRIREEIAKLRETNEQYQEAAKAALEKVHEEKLEAVSLAMEQERARISAEQDALLAKEQLAQAQLELQEVAQKLTEMHNTRTSNEKYIQELQLKLDQQETKVMKLETRLEEQVSLKYPAPWDQFSLKNDIMSEPASNKSDTNCIDENHVANDDEKNEIELKMDECEVTSKEDEKSSENDITEKEDIKKVTFSTPENLNDEDPQEPQNDTSNSEDETTLNVTHTKIEKDEIDTKTLKYQFQSAQNELKRKIESLESIANSNKTRIAELERELTDEKDLSNARETENETLKQELTLTRQQLKENINENTQLKDRVSALSKELELKLLEENIAVKSKEPNQEKEDKVQNISQSQVSYEQLVNIEEELVMLKERFALNTEDKMKLQKELVKMTEQYNSVCNDMHNKNFFYIAPLVLMVLYLLFHYDILKLFVVHLDNPEIIENIL